MASGSPAGLKPLTNRFVAAPKRRDIISRNVQAQNGTWARGMIRSRCYRLPTWYPWTIESQYIEHTVALRNDMYRELMSYSYSRSPYTIVTCNHEEEEEEEEFSQREIASKAAICKASKKHVHHLTPTSSLAICVVNKFLITPTNNPPPPLSSLHYPPPTLPPPSILLLPLPFLPPFSSSYISSSRSPK